MWSKINSSFLRLSWHSASDIGGWGGEKRIDLPAPIHQKLVAVVNGEDTAAIFYSVRTLRMRVGDSMPNNLYLERYSVTRFRIAVTESRPSEPKRNDTHF
ncbi:unnamed protein product [Ceratitis capitata]|uniref:(Mediterranean fruit fly) hypothetical protein n=1 Tax=Ceratitis capitata TaxID=7213 RepID=A0A811V1M3_CERCA|nr:unnamed protein product [Ceratitis capitata]